MVMLAADWQCGDWDLNHINALDLVWMKINMPNRILCYDDDDDDIPYSNLWFGFLIY